MASLPTFIETRTWCHVRIGQEYSKLDCNVWYVCCSRKYCLQLWWMLPANSNVCLQTLRL